MLETVTFKMDRGLLKKIDAKLKEHQYSTRTEFFRDAIRERLSELEKEKILTSIHKLKGILKNRTTDEQLHEIREALVKEYEKKFK